MTTVLRATDSAAFLGIVPSLAGFTPRRSMVLLPFHGSRTDGAMRLDLPDERTDLELYADAAVGLVARVSGTDAVAVVVYTDEQAHPTRDGLVLPHAVVIDEVLGCAEDAGLRVVDALCVTPSGWSSYIEEEPELGPLAQIRLPSDLPPMAGDQKDGTELPRVDLAEKERVGRASSDLAALLDRRGRAPLDGQESPQTIAALLLLDDVPAFLESVLTEPEQLPPFATAALLWCLEKPLLRDVAIAQWATDLPRGIRTLEAQTAFAESGVMVPDDVGEVFLGRGPTPDIERLRRALTVAREAAARAPRLARPAPLTVAAWLSWALGRASHAGRYLEMVREIDPRYSLAALMETMIGAAMLPEWAFRRGPME
ncbi:hypothetical protein RN51_02391 [Microbacterium oxydans]|uniref:DUF4192 domain-containing protein n=1 Tax=Microbacterium oxydans TaxID=82380 RepID=A0A0F0KLQ5_9MICO|nr:DUF4192 family protein [Microbacterium oxydans]KJL21374.1 hypothetical protein RN51_02391 [Microbacterium oxydans]